MVVKMLGEGKVVGMCNSENGVVSAAYYRSLYVYVLSRIQHRGKFLGHGAVYYKTSHCAFLNISMLYEHMHHTAKIHWIIYRMNPVTT